MIERRELSQTIKNDIESAPSRLQADIAIRHWGQIALNSQPGSSDELLIFSTLKRYQQHESQIIREAITETIDERWYRIGFYKIKSPRENPLFKSPITREKEQESYLDKLNGEGYGDDFIDDRRVAILVLANAYSQGINLIKTEFEEKLTVLLGLDVNIEKVYKTLRELCILPDSHRSAPLLSIEGETISLTEDAYKAIELSLQTLNLISYPQESLSVESAKLLSEVKRLIDSSFYGTYRKWIESGIGELMYTERDVSFFAAVSTIEAYIQRQRLYQIENISEEDPKENFEHGHIVLPIILDGKLYECNFHMNKHQPVTDDVMEITLYDHATSSLATNYWGELMTGICVGSSLFTTRALSLSGEFVPKYLQKSLPVESVSISEEELELTLKVKVGERSIGLNVIYAEDRPDKHSVMGNLRKNKLISNNINSVGIFVKNPEYSEINSFGSSLYTASDVDVTAGNEVYQLEDLEGAFVVEKIISEDGIELKFRVDGEESTIFVPKTIDALRVAQEFNMFSVNMTDLIFRNKEKILSDIQNITEVPLSQMFFSLNPERYYQIAEDMQRIEHEVSQMDKFQQWALKVFMASYFSDFSTYEDQYLAMSALVKRYNLDIDQSFIDLIDDTITDFLNSLK